MNKYLQWIAFLPLVLLMGAAYAEDGEEQGEVQYIELHPSFVTNYSSDGRRLKYLKADISVRVRGQDAADKVTHHMPYIRNDLVLLLSAQTDADIASYEGKESLRQRALKAVQKVMEKEEGKQLVDDLLFTSFVVQK